MKSEKQRLKRKTRQKELRLKRQNLGKFKEPKYLIKYDGEQEIRVPNPWYKNDR